MKLEYQGCFLGYFILMKGNVEKFEIYTLLNTLNLHPFIHFLPFYTSLGLQGRLGGAGVGWGLKSIQADGDKRKLWVASLFLLERSIKLISLNWFISTLFGSLSLWAGADKNT